MAKIKGNEQNQAVKAKILKKKQQSSGGSYIVSPALFIGGFFLSVGAACILTQFIVQPRINATSYDAGEPIPFEGALAINDRLTNAEIFLKDQIYGPESLAVHKETGLVYSGLKTGLICEIDLKLRTPKILRAVKLTTNEECDGGYDSAPKCGRPLGLRFNDHNELIVVDAYLGIYAIDFEQEKTIKIVGTGEQPLNDPHSIPLRYLNDFDFLPDGRIIFSESSSKFDDRDFLLEILEHRPNGRLLIYDPRKKDLRVLKDQLYFPNGVQVHPENSAEKSDSIRAFYSEMGLHRIMTIWVPNDPYTKKVIRTQVLIDKLPGYPDNIRLSKSGHLLVAIPTPRTESDEYIMQKPKLREFVTKVLSPKLLSYLSGFFDDPFGLVVKISPDTGKIISSYHDTTGKVSGVTCAVEDEDGNLLLGNDQDYYIARVKS